MERFSATLFKYYSVIRLGRMFITVFLIGAFFTRGFEGPLAGWSFYSGTEYFLNNDYLSYGLRYVFYLGTMLGIVFLSRKIGMLYLQKPARVLAPLLSCLGLVFVSYCTSVGLPWEVLQTIGSISLMVGNAMLWVMWGESYALFNEDALERYTVVTVLGAIAISLMASFLSSAIQTVVFIFGMFLAGLFLILLHFCDQYRMDHDAVFKEFVSLTQQQVKKASGHNNILGTDGRMLLCVFLITAVMGMPPEMISVSEGTFYGIMLSVALVVAVVAIAAIALPRMQSLYIFFKWAIPVLVFGLGASVWFSGYWSGVIAVTVSIAVRLIFCMLSQMFFAILSHRDGVSITRVCALGWFMAYLGECIGWIISVELYDSYTSYSSLTPEVAFALVFMMSIFLFFMHGPTSSFFKSELHSNKGEEAELTLDATHSQEHAVLSIASRVKLTPREQEVFRLLIQGRSLPYIRDRLYISKSTAATHARRIYEKMGVSNRQELIDVFQEELLG